MKKYNIEEISPERRVYKFKVGKKEKAILNKKRQQELNQWYDEAYGQEDLMNAELKGTDNFIMWAFTILIGSGLLVLVMGILIGLGIIK